MTPTGARGKERGRGGGTRRTAINLASNWIGLVLNSVLGFLLAPFILRSLGATAYGAWGLLSSLVGYLGLVDLGVRGAVTKFVATHHAQEDHAEVGRIVSAGLTFFGLSAFLVVLISAALSIWIDRLFSIPPELLEQARVALFLVGVSIAVALVGGVYGGVVVGLQRFDVNNVIYAVVALARALATVLALSNGGGIISLGWIQLVSSLAITLLSMVAAKRLYGEIQIGLGASRSRIRKVIGFGATTSILHLTGMLASQSDAVIIAAFLPLEAVAIFAIAANLMLYAFSIVSSISQLLAPMAGDLEGRGRIDRVGGAILTGGRLATLILVPIAVTFVIRGETFIDLWMGPEYGGRSGPILAILAVALWSGAGFQVMVSGMIGIARHRGLIPAFVGHAVAKLVLSVLLIGPLGVAGVALGTLLPRLAVSMLFAPYYCRTVLEIPALRYSWETWLRPGIAMLPFALATWVVEKHFSPENLVAFFAQVFIALPAALLGAWWFGLLREERVFFVQQLRARLGFSVLES